MKSFGGTQLEKWKEFRGGKSGDHMSCDQIIFPTELRTVSFLTVGAQCCARQVDGARRRRQEDWQGENYNNQLLEL